MRRGSSGLNLILGIDKPLGMSSHDVVNRVRRALGERRVGHAGTLDPAATGVMIVGVGQGTRLMGLLTQDEKSYLARICFGTETNTDDAEGTVVRQADVPACVADESYAREVLASFVGAQQQVPPQFSAISVNGKRSYRRAREGEDFELPPRSIHVHEAELVGIEHAEVGVAWHCSFRVSKGTYIRALARDIGRYAQTAAHLGGLTRTSSGGVALSSCVSLERLQDIGAEGVEGIALDPVRLLGLRTCEVCGRILEAARNGRAIRPQHASPEGTDVALVGEGKLVGVWTMRAGRLVPRVNIPQGVVGVIG